MTLTEFLIKWNGKFCEVAGSPGALNQCVDLANAYIREVLGLPIIEWTNAVDFPSKAGDKYDYILNTPTNIPKEGDIIVWKPSPGHISIFLEGNVDTFKSFDQNFPTGSNCHVQNHTYQNVIGWLRAKNVPQSADDTQKVIDELRTQRDNNWNELLVERSKNTELTQQLQEEQTKNQGLREAFDKQTQADADLGVQLLDSQHKATSYEQDLAFIAQTLKVPDYKRETIVVAIETLQKPVEVQVKPLQDHALTLQDALSSFITSKQYKSLLDRFKAIWKK